MTLTVHCFAAAREIVAADRFTVELAAGAGVAELRRAIVAAHPALGELADFAIAKNEVYALDTDVVLPTDELVIIPPVAGG